MLDIPHKTSKLVEALKAALPFEVELPPQLIAHLGNGEHPIAVGPKHEVSEVFYLGDQGGIACNLDIEGSANPVIVSLTHLKIHSRQVFARAVFEYQKHRIKKIKKQNVS